MLVEHRTERDLKVIDTMVSATDKILDIDDFLQIMDIIQNTINSILPVSSSWFCLPAMKQNLLPAYPAFCRDCGKEQNPGSSILPECKYKHDAGHKVFTLKYKNRKCGNYIIKSGDLSACMLYTPFIRNMLKIFCLKMENAAMLKQEIPVNPAPPAYQSPELYRNLTYYIPAALCIFRMDDPENAASVQLVYANPAVEQTLGIRPEAVSFAAIDKILQGLSAKNLAVLIQDVIHNKQPVSLENRDKNILQGVFSITLFPLPGNHAGMVFINITRHRQTEQELARYRIELEIIFNSDPVAIWLKDKGNRIIRLNRAAADSVGLSSDAIEGKIMHEVLPFEDAMHYYQDDLEVINSGKPKLNLLRCMHTAHGGKRWNNVDIVPYRNPDGEICGVLVFAHDITDTKLIEARLTDTLERLQERETTISALFESAKAVLQKESFFETARVIFDRLKTIIGVKAGYVSLLAADGSEDNLLFLDSGESACTIDSNQLKPVCGLKHEVYKTGKPIYHNNFSNSEWAKNMPPEHLKLKNVMYIPLNVSGKVGGVIGLANKETDFDIKDGAIAAAFGELAAIALKNSLMIGSLKTSEQKYRQLVNTLQEGILVTDKDAIITFVNPEMARMLGYTEEEITGKPIISFLDLHEIDIFKKRFENRKQGIEEKYECEFVKKDGTLIYTRVAAVPLLDNNSNYIGSLGGITDLTERKKAENQLENSLKEKEILLQEIHHRVKNNLMVISSLMGLQIRRLKDKNTQSILEDTRNRIYTMSLTHQLLYQSKNFNSINLSRYVHDLLYYLVQSFRINVKNINIKIEVEEIRLNLNQAIPCGLIINELVSNSIKYAFPCDKQGEINIILYTEKDNIILTVSDDGVGFPEGFDSTKTESLGMFLIHSFAEQLNGKEQFCAEKGVAFSIIFPCNNLQEKEI